MHINNLELVEFGEFIYDMDLLDLQVVGNKFTWFNVVGNLMSRLDRFLIYEGLADKWKIKGQIIGKR